VRITDSRQAKKEVDIPLRREKRQRKMSGKKKSEGKERRKKNSEERTVGKKQ
jgi:hypothetical protein